MLFTPGHKLDWIKKTPRYDPDAIVIDLEDAVPPAEKVAARAITKEGIGFLKSVGIGAFVRLNQETIFDDVVGIMTPGLTGVCRSKLANAAEIRELADCLTYAEGKAGMPRGSVDIVAIPEMAEGMSDIRSLCKASPRVKSVMTAIIDRMSDDVVFQGDTALAHNFLPTKEGYEQFYFTSKCVLESRGAGAPYPVATLIGTKIGDDEAARKIARRIKSFGFTGIVCIHPSHVAVANEIMRPSAKDIEFQVGVLRAMKEAEAKGEWAVNFRGIMIDKANVAIAEGVLAEARRHNMQVPAI